MSKKHSFSIEVLENRIAPAVFFVGTDSFDIHKGTAAYTPTASEISAKDFAGSTAALLLSPGDTLIHDLNNNEIADDGEAVIAKVTGGKAMVFLTNVTGSSAGLDINEVTGVAVSDKFKGTFGVDINGSVLTALGSDGTLSGDPGSINLHASSILSLKVEGQIVGHLLAGQDLRSVTIGLPKNNLPSAPLSVDGFIATGTGADGWSVSLNGGSTLLAANFDVAPGAAAGDIIDVTLDGGVRNIHAGQGGSVEVGKGGDGGSVIGLTVKSSIVPFGVYAGAGGDNDLSGNAGAGGDITNAKVTLSGGGTGVDAAYFVGGAGGASAKGNSGRGGNVTGLTLSIPNSVYAITVAGGDGGSQIDAQSGNGGAGGSVAGFKLTAGNLIALNIEGGNGGDSGLASGAAGAGGSITGASLEFLNVTNSITIESGNGGRGFAKGGAGGAVQNFVSFNMSGASGALVAAGYGGDSTSTKGVPGVGGAIKNLDVSVSGTVTNDFAIRSGAGGGGVFTKSGAGGAISGIDFSSLNTTLPGSPSSPASLASLHITSGNGGTLTAGDGLKYKAGASGAVSGVTVDIQFSTIAEIEIASGIGGMILSGAATGGVSGAVSKVLIKSTGTGDASVHSGPGGSALMLAPSGGPSLPIPIAQASAGNSGAVSGITIDDDGSGNSNFYEIYAGHAVDDFGGPGKGPEASAMWGSGPGTRGGSVGAVSKIVLDAPGAEVLIGGNFSAGGVVTPNTESVAGSGGSISGITGTVGTITISAAHGGAGELGRGGNGGSISNVNLTALDHVHLIAAGDGGDARIAGAGGSITGVVADANIGNFAAAFNIFDLFAGMGGLVAGQRGDGDGTAVNGSIKNINVGTHGIAAIVAGRKDGNILTTNSYVTKISGIKAATLGADTGLTGTGSEDLGGGKFFDYNESSGDSVYTLENPEDIASSDVPIDGLVIVKVGGGAASLPVAPLKLIEI